MMKQIILDSIAPCGLNCSKCFAYNGGNIQRLSRALKKELGEFDIYAQRFTELINETRFKLYPDFKTLLDYFSEDGCAGCRKENCKLFKQCGVRKCHQAKKADFCFECAEFPCNKTNFDLHLQKRWLAINNRIKKIGIENYYLEIKDKPRY